MKKYLAVLIVAVLVLFSCGQLEKLYDKSNYESLTNEIVDITLLGPDAAVYKKFKGAKVLYTDSNSLALWFTHEGTTYYWQGYCLLVVK